LGFALERWSKPGTFPEFEEERTDQGAELLVGKMKRTIPAVALQTRENEGFQKS